VTQILQDTPKASPASFVSDEGGWAHEEEARLREELWDRLDDDLRDIEFRGDPRGRRGFLSDHDGEYDETDVR
jgi:hypothetical protein